MPDILDIKNPRARPLGPLLVVMACVLALAGCGATKVKPEIKLPKALIEPLDLDVGIYYGPEYRKFEYRETRWGSDWQISLGEVHVRLTNDLFAQAFTHTRVLEQFPGESAPAPVKAVIEPRIEQFSFVTPRDTNSNFYAVTIKYRLNLSTPTGALVDSFKFTGYGTADSEGLSAEKPLQVATNRAMRDAASKFLVQFPEQAAVKRLVHGEALVAAEQGQGTSEAEEVPMVE
ncbi:MAG: hypothetical protein JSR95_06860 [Proteobacteria bacterium]|nr:hypothetical protein [Pseudomonadota bacterium]